MELTFSRAADRLLEVNVYRRRRPARHVGLALACFALAGVALGQEATPGNQEPTIQIQVEQVLVPVVVTDRKGHFFTDLKMSDFRVFEDDVEQKLVAMRTEQTGAAELFPSKTTSGPRTAQIVALSPVPGNLPPRHTFLIVLDAQNSAFSNFARIREALLKLFKEEQSSDSQYALVALGRPSLVIQNLTRDPQAVLAALGSKEISRATLSGQTRVRAQEESELTRRLQVFCGSCGGFCKGDLSETKMDDECRASWAEIKSGANAAAEVRSLSARAFVQDLRRVTEQLSQMAGRRELILTSDGFNFQPGRELFQMIAVATNHLEVLAGSGTSDLRAEITAIAKLANTRNVTFYTLDSRGLFVMPSGASFETPDTSEEFPTRGASPMQVAAADTTLESQDAMNYLAVATGGVYYKNSNDMLKGLRQSFADGRQYYVLAYVPSNRAADGKYRTIKVLVNGKNLIVRAKDGYWGPAEEAPPAHTEPST